MASKKKMWTETFLSTFSHKMQVKTTSLYFLFYYFLYAGNKASLKCKAHESWKILKRDRNGWTDVVWSCICCIDFTTRWQLRLNPETEAPADVTSLQSKARSWFWSVEGVVIGLMIIAALGYYAPHIWNKTREHCRSAPTLSSFQSTLKTFLFTTAFHWGNVKALNCTVIFIL